MKITCVFLRCRLCFNVSLSYRNIIQIELKDVWLLNTFLGLWCQNMISFCRQYQSWLVSFIIDVFFYIMTLFQKHLQHAKVQLLILTWPKQYIASCCRQCEDWCAHSNLIDKHADSRWTIFQITLSYLHEEAHTNWRVYKLHVTH